MKKESLAKKVDAVLKSKTLTKEKIIEKIKKYDLDTDTLKIIDLLIMRFRVKTKRG